VISPGSRMVFSGQPFSFTEIAGTIFFRVLALPNLMQCNDFIFPS
jgi:hypothetical protein